MSTKLRTAAAAAACGLLLAGSAQATLIWDGSASRGTGVFKLIGSNCSSPGSVTAVSDATWGRVWRYNKPRDLNRCESHGLKVGGSNFVFQSGSKYYLGWRSKLSNTVNNNANFQWKVFPAPGEADLNWPVVLKMIGGKVTMLNRKSSSEVFEIWSRPIAANQWNHYVVALQLSGARDGGSIELWFNGVKQTFSNSSQVWRAQLFDPAPKHHVCPKWGVYGASTSTVANFVHGLKVGTTLGDVD
ncbi:MAG TPA: heparin lyase I family protein [Vicinamibacteria bacterium]